MQESNIILSVENLSMKFDMDYYQRTSLRDNFISMVKNPIHHILQKRDTFTVLDNINFKVQKGEIVGIVGRNGSGKTTLCRTISGMYKSKSGSIYRPDDMRAIYETSVGIQPELTGRENAWLLSFLMYPRLNKKQRNNIVNESIEFSELNNFIDTPYKNYSKGMQVRLCLSLVSALPNDLLILDEVYDGADEYFQKKVGLRVKNLIHRSGAALFVSHSFDQINHLCNRLIIISKGKIVFDGDVEKGREVYHRSLEVAL